MQGVAKTVDPETAFKGFDRFVQKLMRDWKVNGVSVAVIKDGEIVHCRGYGKRDVDRDLPMTEHTLTPIASITKTFTTMSLGLLADEGLVDWDVPVQSYLPAFRLWDQFASERMTPRDLVTHRSGLPRHDLVWYHSDLSREEIFERLQHLEPTADFRTIWQYQNIMYMTAGLLAGKLAGTTWEEIVRTRIFEPLGMVGSGFSVRAMQETPDFSRGYRKDKKKVVEMPFYEDNDLVGPAGSIVSSVADLAQWLQLHLEKGKRKSAQFVSEAQVSQMHAPQMVMQARSKFPEIPQRSYGLGWFVEPYRGRNMIHHGGNIDGFSTMLALMPDDGVGVAVLANMNATPVRDIIAFNVFDRFMGGELVPWSERWKADWEEMEGAEERGKETAKERRVRGTRPSHRLDAYTGTYVHPGYGKVQVELDGKTLQARYNGMTLELKHYHYDIFELEYKPLDVSMKASFFTNVRGDIDRVAVPMEPTVSDIVFTRIANERMHEREFLEPFAGTYQLLGFDMPVSFKGDVLQVAIPGIPEYELEPIKGTEFALKGLSGMTVEFVQNEAGQVTEAIVSTGQGVYTATRK